MMNRRSSVRTLLFSLFSLSLIAAVGSGINNAAPDHGKRISMPLPLKKDPSLMPVLPLQFIKNEGQASLPVGYHVMMPFGNVFFSSDSISYQMLHRQPLEEIHDVAMESASVGFRSRTKVGNIRLSFLGHSPFIELAATDQLDSHVNFFRGNDPDQWRTGIPAYRAIKYTSLYPGIDLIVHGDTGRMKNEYVIKPGADPKQIVLQYSGVSRLEIDDDGRLRIFAGNEILVEDKPVSYQIVGKEKVIVPSGFRLVGADSVKFEVGKYRNDLEMIIDPELQCSTFLGGSASEQVVEVKTDTVGNIYVLGFSASTNYPTTPGAYDTTYNGGLYDYVITKLDPSASSLIFSTYLGGSGGEGSGGTVSSLEVDRDMNVFVTGYAVSADFPVTSGAYDSTFNGTMDAFITKIGASGASLIYSTFIGGSNSDVGCCIEIDPLGNAYVAGETASTDFPTTPDALDSTFAGIWDIFLIKIDALGRNLLYSTYLGGTGNEWPFGLVRHPEGDLYMTGGTSSTDFPTTVGALDTTYSGGTFDGYALRLSSSGSLIYSTYLGGAGYDVPLDICVDSAGRAYVSGRTDSADFPTTPGAFDTTYNGGTYDGFISSVDPAGSSLVFSTFLGGTGQDRIYEIEIGPADEVYVAGYTYSSDFPMTPDAYDPSFNAGTTSDGFLAELGTSGSSLVYSTFLGGSGLDTIEALTIDPAGSLVLAGITQSTDFPVLPGAYDLTHNGANDIFIAKVISAEPSITVVSPNGGEVWPAATTRELIWTPFSLAGDLTIELYKGGAFHSNIATVPVMAGSYLWNIPPSLESGADYTVRISQGEIVDISDANFSISADPSIMVTAPNGGEVLAGLSYDITWQAPESVTEVKIEYSANGGELWTLIAESAANTGSYTWFVPLGISASCLVRVSDAGNAEMQDTSDAVFSIFREIYVHLIAPNGGESFYRGQPCEITWETSASISDIGIDYSVNGGTEWLSIVASTPNDGTYSWTIPALTSTSCLVRVSDVSNPIIQDRSDLAFSIGSVVTDPGLEWNTFNGGTGWDINWDVAVDALGNVYAVGRSDLSWGSPINPLSGGADAFVAKFDSSGTLLWNTFLGGTASDWAVGVCVSPAGEVFVIGTSGASWGTPVNAYSGGNDVFVAKLDTDGILQWNTFLGSADSSDSGNTIGLDAGGNIRICGSSTGAWGSPVSPYSGGWDGFIASLNSAGALLWHTFLGGEGDDPGGWVDLDPDGNTYVTSVSSAVWGSPLNPFSGGDSDAYVAKLDASGVLLWNTFLGGAARDEGHGLALDANGNAYIVGDSLMSWGAPVSPYLGTDWNPFVAKLNSGGVLQWSTFLGDTGYEEGRAIDIDAKGNICAMGMSSTTWGAPLRPFAGPDDTYVAALDPEGSMLWNLFLGGSAADLGLGLASDSAGNLYVAGESTGTWGAPINPYVASWDGFIAKIRVEQEIAVTSPNGGEDWPVGTTRYITWSGRNLTGDVSVDLQKGGIFQSRLGTATAAAGSYLWTIDTGLEPDADYSIRVWNSAVDDSSNGVFSISGQAGIVLTAPNGGESFPPGLAYEITWETPTDLGGVKIEFSSDAGENWSILADSAPDTGAYSWSVPAELSALCLIKVSDASDPAVQDLSDAVFRISAAVPSWERQALIALYTSTNGDSWTNRAGWKTAPLYSDGFAMPGTEGTWYGVTVDPGSFRVTSINLNGNNLVGPIPALLGSLTAIQTLRLYSNPIAGTIPPELGDLMNLQDLRLSITALSGTIPPELGNLANLRILYLNNNQLTGSIPETLGNLANLQYLYLYTNQLTGPIPTQLGNLPNLLDLRLYNNQLNGSIPAALGNLGALIRLYLYSNQLSGSIPPELGGLGNLIYLFLGTNQLSGPIPPELGSLTKLLSLDLSTNQLTGSIPIELGNLTSLVGLGLSNNQVSGSIPDELSSLTNLTSLSLANNQLSGSVPLWLGNIITLRTIYLNGNQLTGSIPSELGALTNLTTLSLHSNQFTGSIPNALGSLTNLYYLRLSSNYLTGQIPGELGNLVNLRNLALDRLQLEGSIPSELGNLTLLQILTLNSNKLSGPIPASLVGLTSLVDGYLDIGYNALFSTDEALTTFLNTKDPDWATTQTVEPTGVTAVGIGANTVQVSWTPIAYTTDPGEYRVFWSDASSGPYTLAGQTADKSATSLAVTGLMPATPYYFVVQTRTEAHENNQNVLDSGDSEEASGATLAQALIMGRIILGGLPLANVTLSGLPGSPVTDPSGVYVDLVDIGWGGTVTPALAGYSFDPPSRTYIGVSYDQLAQDYVAALIPATITVTSPNGGEVFAAGSVRDITWTSTGGIENVRIEYSVNNGTDWLPVMETTANTGTYPWTVPGPATTTGRIRVSDAASPGTFDTSDAAFRIVVKEDLLATWDGQGVYYRNSDTGLFVRLASPATMIAAGDLEGDGIDDLIGLWPTQGGIWVKYSSTGAWARLSSTAVHIAAGDMNGDGRVDLLGTWDGQGVYYRDSISGAWVKLASPATLITTGDLDGDNTDDLIGIWPTQGGVWVKYSSTSQWARLSSTARDIAAGDMNGDGRDDLLATWDGQGVYYRDSISGAWVKMASQADQVACGDLDADGTDDLIGIWPTQGGVWVKYSSTSQWARLSSTARDISAGVMRAQGAAGAAPESPDGAMKAAGRAAELLPLPMGGTEEGPGIALVKRDLSDQGPSGARFVWIEDINLDPSDDPAGAPNRIPGPGEPGFVAEDQKNLIPGERFDNTRDKSERRRIREDKRIDK